MILAPHGLLTTSVLATSISQLPYIETVRAGTTPYVAGATRRTAAEIVFQDEGDARRASRQLMVNVLDQIAEGEIEGVDGWTFMRHDHRPVRFVLPDVSHDHSGHNVATEAVTALVRLREGMRVQAFEELPDTLIIRGPEVESDAPVNPRHEMMIQWLRMNDSGEVRADIIVSSPLAVDEADTPFFTLESLQAYLEAAE